MSTRTATAEAPAVNYYEVLQISVNAEIETIHRVYRMLAQKFHPDNQATGDEERFRRLTEAYHALSDPALRAQYDALHFQQQKERARLLSEAVRTQSDVESEQLIRLTLLEVLYARRRCEPHSPGIFDLDLEELVGRPREHLEFTLWYLGRKGLVERTDGSRLVITVEGVDYLEQNGELKRRVRMLPAAS